VSDALSHAAGRVELAELLFGLHGFAVCVVGDRVEANRVPLEARVKRTMDRMVMSWCPAKAVSDLEKTS
jgi:hypothetical protein